MEAVRSVSTPLILGRNGYHEETHRSEGNQRGESHQDPTERHEARSYGIHFRTSPPISPHQQATEYNKVREDLIHISTGCKELDAILGGSKANIDNHD